MTRRKVAEGKSTVMSCDGDELCGSFPSFYLLYVLGSISVPWVFGTDSAAWVWKRLPDVGTRGRLHWRWCRENFLGPPSGQTSR